MELGTYDPCHCDSGKKYKWCCLERDKGIAAMKKAKTITISKHLFVGGPYTDCPSCKRVGTFGKSIMNMARGYNKECVECDFKQSFPLPKIKKKIIYLDQFVISNMMKALNPKSRSYAKIRAEQPHWLELYRKLDVLSKQQLIICPDSMYHRDESIVGEHYEETVRIYEHLSHGTTFFDHMMIERMQLAEHFRNYLDGKSNEPLTLDPEKVVWGNLHDWEGGLRVSVGHRARPGEIDGLRKQRESGYVSLLSIFERWKGDTSKTFEEQVLEEAGGLGSGLWQAAEKFLIKRAELMERFAQTGQMDESDLSAVFPPQSNDILNEMLTELAQRGITGQEARDKMNEYFKSKDILHVPSVKLTSLLFAAVARQASLGRTNPPSRGMFNDVYAIASLLPYCDAIFIDREMAGITTTNPVQKEIDYPARVFSVRDFDAFMAYLDSIVADAAPEHMQLVEDVYGETKPYMSILRDDQIGDV